jgi:hypothetical protein
MDAAGAGAPGRNTKNAPTPTAAATAAPAAIQIATGRALDGVAALRGAAISTAASGPPSSGAGMASCGKIGPVRVVGAGKPAIVEPLSITGAVMLLLVWE